MDEPALRDIERWKDKIEVRLDNRQIFFLFFGSALCACMLFVLGVIVGKRLESRGRAETPEVQDPLAVLDRINGAVAAGAAVPASAAITTDRPLTFPRALIGDGSGKGNNKVRAPALAPVVAAARPPVPILPKAAVAAVKPPAASPPKPVAAPTPAAASATKGKFTLQLSSFPDKDEAEAFAKKFAGQGAYVVVSEIPGKGTWYRVRVGSYASSQEAIAAKGTFEKQNNVIAYIAGR